MLWFRVGDEASSRVIWKRVLQRVLQGLRLWLLNGYFLSRKNKYLIEMAYNMQLCL